jgi:ABC-type antimicrobial peptide transport system ATPase subunit
MGKNNARWWSENNIDDETFIGAIEFLVSKKIINVSENPGSQSIQEIPEWVKTDARWWSENNIDDETFIGAIEFLIKIGTIKIS